MKPVQHEHAVELKLSPELQQKVDTAKESIVENKKPLLFGAGGVVLGVVLTRLFSRPQINVHVDVNKDILS